MLTSDEHTGQRWSTVCKHLNIAALSTFDALECGPQELGIAKIHLGLALCYLFAPTYLLDPLEIKGAEIKMLETLVC